MDKIDKNNLQKRYLVWFYKTVKEALDKIDRKFTQLEVDKVVAGKLKLFLRKDLDSQVIHKLVSDFDEYMAKKERDSRVLKYGYVKSDKETSQYKFLKAKLKSIELTIEQIFGAKELNRVKRLYEEEMTNRIIQSREH